jgi:SnoaL-like domain
MERFWGLAAPDIVMATDRRWPGGGEFHGREEFERFLGQFTEAFSDVHYENTQAPAAHGADVALFTGKWVGQGAASGIETISFEFSMVMRLNHDGLMAESRFFFDAEAAKEYARSPT